MKCRYKSALQQDDNVKVEVTTGEHCADLPAENTKVMVEYYPAIGKCVVTASNMLKNAKYFKNADDLASYLLDKYSKPKRKPATTSKADNSNSTRGTRVDNAVAENAESIGVDASACNVDNGIADVDYSTVDMETGELFNCRTSKSLHLTWITVAKQILASYKWDKCLFITCTMASRPDYDEMNHLATGFINRLKKQFRDEFQGIHKFLEPCDDGSWHVHYIACFHDVPETFEKWAKRWWARKQGYDNPKQVEVRAITSQADLEATIRYLNPCSTKKEHRIPHYPKNCQCMRGYGDYAMPTIAICEYNVTKKIVGHEDPTKRKNIRVIDADTNVELYYRIEYHFTGFIISHCEKQHYDISADKLKMLEPKPVQKSLLQSVWKDADCAERNTALWQDYKYAMLGW